MVFKMVVATSMHISTDSAKAELQNPGASILHLDHNEYSANGRYLLTNVLL